MRRYYLVLLIFWVHCGDLLTSWLYGGGSFPGAAYLRPSRDLTVILVATACLLCVRMPSRLMVPILTYGLLTFAYLPVGWAYGVPATVLIGSLGTLMIPMLFFLVGYFCIRNIRELRATVLLIVVLGFASTLFGMWDVNNTAFWTETVQLPDYMAQIKGVQPSGTDPLTRLPWNYFGGEDLQRRAGGLLAAPLAQGSFLAVSGVLALAWSHDRKLTWLGVAANILMFAGVWMSGTRGAMLLASIALIGYAAVSRQLSRGPAIRLLLASGVILAVVLASHRIVAMTVNFLDGSTIGHWTALQHNLQDLPKVLIFGGGLGRQGPVAGTLRISDIGGGEGAIFSIAFQMGLPAALLFLYFYIQCMKMAWQSYRRQLDPLSLAMFWLCVGITTTLITSEHILAVSGTSAFWIILGGLSRVALKREHDDAHLNSLFVGTMR